MKPSRLVGILWVLAGLVMLGFAYGREPRSTAHLVLGVVFVALGAAIVRRSRRARHPG